MIKKNIVFITGAGASIEFGFPTGEKLVNLLLSGGWGAIEEKYSGIDNNKRFFRKFQNKLKKSNTSSIDIFIANNPEYAELAKLLIAKNIALIEQNSIEKINSNSWLKYLWSKMIDKCMSFNDFKNNKIKFVTFNYDRTLEIYFARSIVNFFKTETDEIEYKNILKTVPIYHVFGKIGNMHWENPEKFRSYGAGLGNYSSWLDIGK